MGRADTPLPIYAQQRRNSDDIIPAAMKDGNDPAVVGKTIVAAATDPKPKLGYTAARGPHASVCGAASSLPEPWTNRLETDHDQQ